MFNPDAKISSRAEHDRLLRLHAIDEAGAIFRKYGVAAIEIVSAGLVDQSKTADERRYDRLMIVELERLDRLQRHGPPSTGIVPWKPPLFSRAGIAALFGFKIAPKRKGGLH
jgi:hypothetical protein